MNSILLEMPSLKRYLSSSLFPVFTHRVKTDAEVGRFDRPRLPMVRVFDENRMTITREWQMFLVAINYLMRRNNISHMLNDDVAFCNNSGFQGDHHRRNYILMEDLTNELPQFDKTRTCGDAKVFIQDGLVKMLDGRNPPPLKPGYKHPMSTDEALTAFNRYLYTPLTHPEFFFPATTTGTDHLAHPWPGAAYYPWYKNGSEPVAWMLHVSDAPVIYPPQQWTNNTPYLEVL